MAITAAAASASNARVAVARDFGAAPAPADVLAAPDESAPAAAGRAPLEAASRIDAPSGSSSLATRSTNAAVAWPPGNRVHCTSRNLSGTLSSSSRVSSITTGSKKVLLVAIKCERSTASFHSSRK